MSGERPRLETGRLASSHGAPGEGEELGSGRVSVGTRKSERGTSKRRSGRRPPSCQCRHCGTVGACPALPVRAGPPSNQGPPAEPRGGGQPLGGPQLWLSDGSTARGEARKTAKTSTQEHEANLTWLPCSSFVQTAPASVCWQLERLGGTGPGRSRHRHRVTRPRASRPAPWPASERRPRAGAAAATPHSVGQARRKKSTTDDPPATLRRPHRGCTALWCVSGAGGEGVERPGLWDGLGRMTRAGSATAAASPTRGGLGLAPGRRPQRCAPTHKTHSASMRAPPPRKLSLSRAGPTRPVDDAYCWGPYPHRRPFPLPF